MRGLLLALFLASPALADSARINIQVKGSPKVKAQLAKSLCKEHRCVKPGKKKAAAVDAVVFGRVKGGKLKLEVYTDPDEAAVSEQFRLAKKGTLPKEQLASLVLTVAQALEDSGEE